MKTVFVVFLSITIILLIILLVSPAAHAALDAFELNWWTVDSGGGQSTGADYSLLGVDGQPDAGYLQGGDFSLAGGYFGGAFISPPLQNKIYIPIINK